jgi:serine/threonine protein kinase
MSIPDPSSLEHVLTRLNLVDEATLDECRRDPRAIRSVDDYIAALVRRNALTPYQVGRLKKGETEGLRLGPYKLLYRNAAGSFARVYRAASVEDGRIIGIKLLRQRWASDPRIVALFRREGELGKRLKHKNIVPIYDVVSEGNKHYFTMEFVEGGNFRDLLKIRGKFSPAEATKYICDMAEGLQYALTQGVTHRDLKLTNVLLSSQGVAKLVDFGLAGNDRALSQFDEEVDRALEYAALERGSNAPDNDPRSDLYFLGAIYYELLTGKPPYPPTRDRQERKRFSRYKNIRPLRSVDPNIPAVLEEYVRHLMHVNPNDRYQTPAVLLSDLRAVLPDLRAAERTVAPPAAGQQNGDDEIPLAADDTDTALTGSDTSNDDVGRGQPPLTRPSVPTVLCVESRPKHQDVLRDYFARHGYRVLLLSDPQRALNRMLSAPPEAFVLMGDSVGNQLPAVFRAAASQGRQFGTVVVAVLGKKAITGIERLQDEPLARVLPQPTTLRDIRHAISELRERNASAG